MSPSGFLEKYLAPDGGDDSFGGLLDWHQSELQLGNVSKIT